MVSSSSSSQPVYGSRLLPQVLDGLAKSKPERIYASVPATFDLKDGFRDVTVLQLSRAVDRFAWWLEENIGSSSTFETIAYLGLPDIRYTIVFLAAVKCGFKVLFPSPRNTTFINDSLIDQTECSKFLASPEMVPKAQQQQQERKTSKRIPKLRVLEVPALNDMLVERDQGKYYPYGKDFATARWDPIVVLHSSGSTGVPKPIVLHHATVAVVDNDRNLPTVLGRRNLNFSLWNFGDAGGFSFSSFPPFHLGGFMAYIVLPIYSSDSSLILGPANKPSTGRTAVEVMRRFDLKALFCPPNIFEQLLQEPDGIELAKKLEFILYAGGPLTNATGTALSKVTDVCQFYGSTETIPVQTLVPRPEDWDTLEWHPLFEADMQPSVDDAHELVLHRDVKFEGIRGFDCNFPKIDEWRTKDLFRQDPIKPQLWRFHGRLDDIIVLSNGEKFNPVPSEAIITSHPLVSAALIVGQGRFQAALLIEPAKTDKSPSQLIDELWPTIEKANAQAQSHGRIIRTMVAVVDPSKPFERAGKGTVVRRLTTDNFRDEIADLYLASETGKFRGGPKLSEPNDANSVRKFVQEAVAFSFPTNSIKASDDLYVHGLDSLKTVEIVAILKGGLQAQHSSWLSNQTLYTNPTIERLARYLFQRLQPQPDGQPAEDVNGKPRTNVELMADLALKYTDDLHEVDTKTSTPPEHKCIVLTGSTGSLGKRLLSQLLTSPHVTKIYCFDRNPNARAKHSDTLANHKLEGRIPVEFVQVDYGHEDFGLPPEKYRELLDFVNIIIHAAWKVDFNHALESFEPVHIQGVRHFIDWQIQSPRAPHLVFISSTSSVSQWPTLRNNKGPIPDRFIDDLDAAQAMGYGESKNVAEHILYEAAQKAGISSTILRIGQIAGPLNSPGVWNEDEWVPALLKSSKSLGCLPAGLPDVDWIPVDSLAKVIMEISFARRVSGTSATSPDFPPDAPLSEGMARIQNAQVREILEDEGLDEREKNKRIQNVRVNVRCNARRFASKQCSFFNLVNPHLTPWSTILETLQAHLGIEVTVSLAQWIQRLEQVDATDPKSIARFPAIKILDFFRSLAEYGDVRYSTQKAVAASETMANLPAIDGEAMEVWLGQWGY
ncbi:MAG: hypothetical protein Q9170_004253 [Blastenia crenularia]